MVEVSSGKSLTNALAVVVVVEVVGVVVLEVGGVVVVPEELGDAIFYNNKRFVKNTVNNKFYLIATSVVPGEDTLCLSGVDGGGLGDLGGVVDGTS